MRRAGAGDGNVAGAILLHVGGECQCTQRTGGGGAIVQRQLRNERVVFGVAQRGALGIDLVGCSADVDGDRLGGDCKRGVDAEILSRYERDSTNVGGREAGACDRDHVLARFDVVEEIGAISVGGCCAVGVLFYAVQRDGSSRDSGSR